MGNIHLTRRRTSEVVASTTLTVGERPHPAVPPKNSDPVVLDHSFELRCHPKAMILEWVGFIAGEVNHLWSATYYRDGQHYTPIELPDGRLGVWGVDEIEHGLLELSPSGPWIHLDEAARLSMTLEDGTGEDYNGDLFDYHADPSNHWGDGFFSGYGWEELHEPIYTFMYSIWAHRLPTTPGQPQFFEHAQGGALVRWEASLYHDEYEVRGSGGIQERTEDEEIHIPTLAVGDWVCIYPVQGDRVFDETGEPYRCNTWREQ